MGAWARSAGPREALAAKCPTQIGSVSEAGQFRVTQPVAAPLATRRSAAKAGRARGYCRRAVLGRAKPRGPGKSRGRAARHAPELALTLRCQSATRALRREGCVGALGSAAWSVAAKCQTNFGPVSKAGQFRKRSAAKAGRARAPALIFLPWARPMFRTVSPVCDRRNATIAICVGYEADRGSGVERAQSWRVRPRARAEQCHALGRREAVGDQGRASASRPSHRAWLCDAGELQAGSMSYYRRRGRLRHYAKRPEWRTSVKRAKRVIQTN